MFGDHYGSRFFRGERRRSSFQKGDLKYVLLGMIQTRPRHGYDIIRELEEQSQGFYKPSPGVIYPTLQMLEEMGYIVSNEQEGKKIYSITDEGREFLKNKKDVTDNIRNQVKSRWSFKNLGRMAVVMKEYHALEHIISSGIRTLDAEKSERIRQVLINTCQEIEAILEEG